MTGDTAAAIAAEGFEERMAVGNDFTVGVDQAEATRCIGVLNRSRQWAVFAW